MRWTRVRLLGAVASTWMFATGAARAQTPQSAPPPPAVPTAASESVRARSRAAEEPRVSLDLTNVTIDDALHEVAKQASVELVYSPFVVPVQQRVSVKLVDAPLTRALEAVLRGTGVEIGRRSGNQIALSRPRKKVRTSSDAADSTQGVIWGQVRDSVTGRVLAGVQVGIRGTALGVASNDSGFYFLRPVPYGQHTIVARRFGYEPVEVIVVVVDSLTHIELRLHPHVEKMEQVVVTATGPQRRLEIPNDITTINVDSVMQTAPVRSVTDLLETRVPGLEVEHTSGEPGAPARIRLRGVSSITRNNDPIVVLDGVRIDVSESGNHSIANPALFTAPSRLDQIDPSSVETIEVFKGPSAAALYGPDAANGVIVITTKKGRPGPAQWSFSVTQGLTTLPGRYPVGLYRFGHLVGGGSSILCPRAQYTCTPDSLVAFQALNDPRYRPFSQGNRTAVNASLSGGTAALQYSFTGSGTQEVGLLQLPDIEVARYEKFHHAPPPSWMRRPDHFTTWGGTSQLSATLSPRARVSIITTLSSRSQQQSDLQSAIASLEGRYIDASQLAREPLIDQFFQRATSKALDFTNVAQVSWEPRTWLPITADVGLNVGSRNDQTLLPPHLSTLGKDSTGAFGIGTGRVVTRSANLGTNIPIPLPLGMRMTAALGMNLTATSSATQSQHTNGLADGQELPGTLNDPGFQATSDATTLGWYLAPTFTISPRLYLSTGFRIDGGSTSGTHATFNGFPKLGFSWLASDETFFPAALRSVFNTLRLRLAYGHAGVQPGLTDRLRLYTNESRVPPGASDPVELLRLQSLGNTQLRPERSTELEGGFDADLFDNRISISYSGYTKLRKDAIVSIPVAPSVDGFKSQIVNIGEVRNTGTEVSLGVEALRSDLLSWRVNVNFSTNDNKLLRLAPGQKPITFFPIGDVGTPARAEERLAAGYPLFGRWAKPVLGYTDRNLDGIIDSTEVLIGDTAVYIGQPLPRYHASFATTLGLFRNRVTIDATFDYQDGQSQVSTIADGPFAVSATDPNASLAAQAAVAALSRTPYGLTQTVNTLRFNSLAVSVAMPDGVARAFRSRSMFVTLRGANLGLYTNYRGLDPSVNAGELGQDSGQLPQPRTWELSVRLGN